MWSCDKVSFKDIYCCIMHTFMFNKVEGCIQYILCSRLVAKHARSGPCLFQLLCKICLGHESGCSINSLLFFYIDSWSLILMFITYGSNYRLQPNRSDWPRWSMTRTMQILRIKWNRYKKLLSFKVNYVLTPLLTLMMSIFAHSSWRLQGRTKTIAWLLFTTATRMSTEPSTSCLRERLMR